MPLEGRILGKIDFGKETLNGTNRVTIKNGNEIEENKMVIRAGFKEGVS